MLDGSAVVFAASDALSHYIFMMYELANSKEFDEELAEEKLNSLAIPTSENGRDNEV